MSCQRGERELSQHYAAAKMPHMAPLPALFIGHGSPMNALEDNRYTRAWYQLGRDMVRPTSILAISAHWYIPQTAVTAMERPETIHDFGGFPKALFDFQYPAPGDPALAARVQQLLAPVPVAASQEWGLDHGTWSILAHMFPAADIPVVQLSLDARQAPQFHYDLGRKLAPLRDEGVLLVANGNLSHNLRMIRWEENAAPFPWTERIAGELKQRIAKSDHAALIDYPSLDPDMRLAVPTPEHYLPLLYILGAQRADDKITFPVDAIDMGSISMLSVSLTPS